jgi:hypothetical protein
VKLGDGGLSEPAQLGVEDNLAPAFGFDVEDGASWDFDAEHFFEAKGLGAELNFIVIPLASPAAFIFDGIRLGMKLDEVGDADEPKAIGAQPQTTNDAATGIGLIPAG